MVDKERRRKLALHLRHLSVGRISNDDFEVSVCEDVSDGWLPEQYYRSKKANSETEDPVIMPMLELCWGLYDDTRRHKLVRSDELPAESLKNIARWILFLRSNKEYEWPYCYFPNPIIRLSFKDLLLSLFTLGYHYRLKKAEQQAAFGEWSKSGDKDYWPFLKKSDYEEALAEPSFLAGHSMV